MSDKAEWCPLRGGVHQDDMMGGEEPFVCPSYCMGQQVTLVEEKMFGGKFGPEIPKLVASCVEAEEPKVLVLDTFKMMYWSFKKVIENNRSR